MNSTKNKIKYREIYPKTNYEELFYNGSDKYPLNMKEYYAKYMDYKPKGLFYFGDYNEPIPKQVKKLYRKMYPNDDINPLNNIVISDDDISYKNIVIEPQHSNIDNNKTVETTNNDNKMDIYYIEEYNKLLDKIDNMDKTHMSEINNLYQRINEFENKFNTHINRFDTFMDKITTLNEKFDKYITTSQPSSQPKPVDNYVLYYLPPQQIYYYPQQQSYDTYKYEKTIKYSNGGYKRYSKSIKYIYDDPQPISQPLYFIDGY